MNNEEYYGRYMKDTLEEYITKLGFTEGNLHWELSFDKWEETTPQYKGRKFKENYKDPNSPICRDTISGILEYNIEEEILMVHSGMSGDYAFILKIQDTPEDRSKLKTLVNLLHTF